MAPTGKDNGPQQDAPDGRDEAARPAPLAASPQPLAVVGIGASAGGFEAVREFLLGMPPDSGLCFVYIQHLAPDYKSLMAELLARFTRMRVVEATEGMPLAPNLVAVAPPNRYVRVVGNRLRLIEPTEQRGARLPIDYFLQTLAVEKREAAIGVILSGAGSDGALGIKAIKEYGGMVMAEDAAAYDAMPRAAIETGQVDHILPVAQMPEALLGFVSHDYVARPDRSFEYSQDHLIRILSILQSHTKRNFKSYKKKTVVRRIERRMGLSRISDMAAYIDVLRENPAEIRALAKDLLISVTNFFRDPETFEALQKDVLTPLVQRASYERPLRVWVAGCATGEEAYSIAMMLIESFAEAGKEYTAQIFATDLDADALEVGRAGLYPESIEADVSPARLQRFFVRDGAFYRVTKQLRETVMFAVQNLLADPPFSKMDLITCRNLLIYIEPEVQKNVLALFHFVLTEGGALMLGSSETIGRLHNQFEPVSKKDRIYRRVGAPRLSQVHFPLLVSEDRNYSSLTPGPATGAREILPAEMARQVLLEEYAPASVLVNRRGQVLYFYGDTTRYLEFPTGEPSQDLVAIARDGLRTKLRTALHRAIQSEEEVSVTGVRLRRNGGYFLTRFRVVPLQRFKAASGLLLVSFMDEPAPAPDVGSDHADKEDGAVRQLELELQATKEDLQSTIEELETSNEELKASNEEIMSINEELQSSNEELETSKEELQSLNEELTTVNSQLHDKVEELEATTNDLANLLSSTDIATIFLDTDLRIKRFTPSINRLFNLIPSDVGRPISDISQKFYDETLLADLRAVLAKLIPVEKQIATMDGGYCIRRVLPYRTHDNRIDGAVVTFTDVTQLKRITDNLAIRAQRGAAVLEVGQQALSGVAPEKLGPTALEVVAQVLKADLACLFEPSPGGGLALGHHHGRLRKIPKATVGSDASVDVGYVYWARGSLVVRDFAEEKRMRSSLSEVEPDIASGIVAVIDGIDRPSGVLAAYGRKRSQFSDEDLEFLRAVANLLGMAANRRQAEMEIHEARDFAQEIVDSVREPLVVIDARQLVLSASRPFFATFRLSPDDVEQRSFWDILGGQWNIPELRNAIGRVISQGETVDAFEVSGDFHGLGSRSMVLNARRIDTAGTRVLVAIEDVTDRARAAAALADAKARAEQASEAKTRFLAAASHDLRQPVQAANLFYDTLLAGNKDQGLTPLIENLGSSLHAMAVLLDALLNISKLDAGVIRVNAHEVALDEVLGPLLQGNMAAANAKGLRLRYVPTRLVVWADPDLLMQLVQNLLSNAVRYTDRGKILVGCRRRGGRIEIHVADTGIGIDEAHLPHIFSEFYQVNNEAQQIAKGLGLGLSIVDRLARLLASPITVRSVPGKGSDFIVSLPRPGAAPASRK